MAGWISIISITLAFHFARPARLGDRHWKVGGSTSWDSETVKYMLYLCIISLVLSLLGILVNSLRNRRKKDYFHVNLIVLAVISVIGIIIYNYSF